MVRSGLSTQDLGIEGSLFAVSEFGFGRASPGSGGLDEFRPRVHWVAASLDIFGRFAPKP